MAENAVVYQARLHWILFTWPALLFGVALILGYQIPALREPSMIVEAIALLWEFMVWMTYQFSLLIIKNKQVILCTGVLVRKTLDIPLSKIESIDIRQSVLGSIFHYGSLVITGTGGTRQYINYLNKPLTCRRYIEQMMHQ